MSLTLTEFQDARVHARPWLRRTPLEHSRSLGQVSGAEAHLKLENLQLTGSFKLRGPLNRLRFLSPAEREQGVVAATVGNHGLGLCHAGGLLEVPVHICLPRSADASKVARLREYGAHLHFTDSFEAAHHLAVELAARDGLTFVSAYSDPAVIAGDGVIGLEVLDDLADPDLLIVPCGGGGLVAGIAFAMKALRPATQVWLVEAATSPTFNTWLRTGTPGPVPLTDSIAEGLAGYVEPETLTWPLIRSHVDRGCTVTDDELTAAMRWMLEEHGFVVEPSGAAAVAVLRRGLPELRGKKVVVVVSGGNVARERFLSLVPEGRRARGSGADEAD